MSVAPLSTIFRGDVLVEAGTDTTSYGFGNVTLPKTLFINGTTNSTGTGTGSLILAGGLSIAQDSFFTGAANVLGTSNLNTTNISTLNGPTTVTGLNAVSISVGSSSQFVTTAGSLSLAANSGNLIMSSGATGNTALSISATNSAGFVQINGGTSGTGGIIMNTGTGGYSLSTVTGGPITLTGTGASFQNVLNTTAAAQNLSLLLNNAFDSGIIIQSAGTNATQTAIALKTTALTGSITIANSPTAAATGGITVQSAGGSLQLYAGTTTTASAFKIAGFYSASSIILNTTAVSQNLSIGTAGSSDSSLILQGSGTNSTQTAVLIQTTNTAGTIQLSNATGTGSISLLAGTGGLSGITQSGGAVTLTSTGAQTTISNTGDFPISINAPSATANSVINISSSSTNVNSLNINTLSGGIFLNAGKRISIQSTDTATGIIIGTQNPIPIGIGNIGSTTIIYGNLDVKGSTTTIESNVVSTTDNILFLNASPSVVQDSGLTIKRYQPANNTSLGDIVSDTPYETGTAQGGTATTITLSASSVGTTVGYYNGWWLKITSGTGVGQVRQIKSFAGSTTNIATIYGTADQTTQVPVQGLNFATPDATSVYALYNTGYTSIVWDSTNKEWCVEYSSLTPLQAGNIIRTGYSNFHMNNLIANNITAANINGITSDTVTSVTLANTSVTPVTITGFPSTNGVYLIFIKPDSTNPGAAMAIFVAGRNNNAIAGTTQRLISIKGSNNEQLDMLWLASAKPQLLFRPPPGTGTSTIYNLRIVSYY
jgi:hypothetical protein